MPGTLYIPGLYTGMDWQGVIDKIMQIEHKQVDLLNSQKQTYQDKLSAWQDLNTKLLNVKTQAEGLNTADAFNIFTVGLSASSGNAADYLTATADSSATPGTYQLTIKQLALAKVDSSGSFTSSTDALNLSGTLELKKSSDTTYIDITIDTTDSLTTIKDKINQYTSQTGVVASIVQYATGDYRLILTAQDTGTANTFDVYNNTIAQDLGFYDATTGTENTIQAAQDAIVNVYGTDATRSSNTITDLIPGVTLNLLNADSTVTINLTVNKDVDTITSNIKDLFDKLNDVFTYINQQSDYTEGQKAPPLIGDSALTFLKADLRDKITSGVTFSDGTTHYLFEIGINVNDDGTYTVDETKLKDALKNNFDTVKNLFTQSDTGVAVRLDSFLSFITDETQNGYVQTRMDEIQTNIDNLDQQITDTEKRLDIEKDQLYEQFTTLEKYMAQMQQMQQWLSQQLSSLSK